MSINIIESKDILTMAKYQKALDFINLTLSPVIDGMVRHLHRNYSGEDILSNYDAKELLEETEISEKLYNFCRIVNRCILKTTPGKTEFEQVMNEIEKGVSNIDLESAADILCEHENDFSREQLEEIRDFFIDEKNNAEEQFDIFNSAIDEILFPSGQQPEDWDGESWKHRVLQVTDLPIKAQIFIDSMNLDVSNLRFLHLTPDNDGDFFEEFDDLEWRGMYHGSKRVVYFKGDMRADTVIHELTHHFLYHNDFNTKAIVKNFINDHGENSLTNYARFNISNSKTITPEQIKEKYGYPDLPGIYNKILENEKNAAWDEVVCEIAATYGRCGQFNKIKELFHKHESQIRLISTSEINKLEQ